MIEETLEELRSGIEKAQDALKRDLAKLRTGRAHPAMLDSVKVDYYGNQTPVSQMATVNVPEPRLLLVKAWDKSQVKVVEKAIRESGLGLNPQVDGELMRIPIPPLSEERRKDLVKLAKKSGEDCKVSVRKSRHDALDMLKELKDSGDASEDEVDRAKKKVEEITAEAGQSVDAIIAAKEKDIIAV